MCIGISDGAHTTPPPSREVIVELGRPLKIVEKLQAVCQKLESSNVIDKPRRRPNLEVWRSSHHVNMVLNSYKYLFGLQHLDK